MKLNFKYMILLLCLIGANSANANSPAELYQKCKSDLLNSDLNAKTKRNCKLIKWAYEAGYENGKNDASNDGPSVGAVGAYRSVYQPPIIAAPAPPQPPIPQPSIPQIVPPSSIGHQGPGSINAGDHVAQTPLPNTSSQTIRALPQNLDQIRTGPN